jgi:hypothetical protein
VSDETLQLARDAHDTWKARCERAEAERDALRGQAEMHLTVIATMRADLVRLHEKREELINERDDAQDELVDAIDCGESEGEGPCGSCQACLRVIRNDAERELDAARAELERVRALVEMGVGLHEQDASLFGLISDLVRGFEPLVYARRCLQCRGVSLENHWTDRCPHCRCTPGFDFETIPLHKFIAEHVAMVEKAR